MDIDTLHLTAVSGYNFNIEEKVLLQSGLTVLKQDYKLAHVEVWGKILGTQRDYILAQGYKNSPLDSTHFFSFDAGLNWGQLQSASPQHLKKAETIYRRFLGDPAFVYNQGITFGVDLSVVKKEGEEEAPFTEEKRLAAVVALINQEAVALPKGAFYKDHKNEVQKNPVFSGLNFDEAGLLKSYHHLKITEKGAEFETIDNDTPSGSWTIKKDQTARIVLVQSLVWPGYSTLHQPTTNQFGYIYVGTGQKNHDMGFML